MFEILYLVFSFIVMCGTAFVFSAYYNEDFHTTFWFSFMFALTWPLFLCFAVLYLPVWVCSELGRKVWLFNYSKKRGW